MNAATIHVERHHPRRHSAARTDDYVYSQLIPYIGNKRRLLPLIARALAATDTAGGAFVDLFTGSTVVSRFAKTAGYRVISNDWEPYSFEIARGSVEANRTPAFDALGGCTAAFEALNALSGVRGYVATHLCPARTDAPDFESERMFFTRENGERIDAIRGRIEEWEQAGAITPMERAFVLTALLYAVSYVSNTSGVFKGFHRGWGGTNGTALYRILSDIRMRPPIVYDNGATNVAFREDAQSLASRLADAVGGRPDVVYLDPPYNQHPYGSNYHVLNTVTLWDKPPLNPSISVNGKKTDKSAIRKDWRTERRSPYNSTKEASSALRLLVESIDARWILLSYSTDGNVPLETLFEILAARGDLSIYVDRYKRYRVSPTRPSPKSHNAEFVAVIDLAAPSSTTRVDELVSRVLSHEGTPDGGQMVIEAEEL